MMWATSSVWKPRSKIPLNGGSTNIDRSAAPITISGVAIGRMIRRLLGPRPRNW
jgi:hypothetical protein